MLQMSLFDGEKQAKIKSTLANYPCYLNYGDVAVTRKCFPKYEKVKTKLIPKEDIKLVRAIKNDKDFRAYVFSTYRKAREWLELLATHGSNLVDVCPHCKNITRYSGTHFIHLCGDFGSYFSNFEEVLSIAE